MKVTRSYRFASSHRLHTPELDDETNRAVFGKCNNPHGHGHNYRMEVTVEGPVNRETGLAVDVPALDALVQREIVAAFDHRNLNADVREFQTLVPTTENLAVVARDRLAAGWPATMPRLARIRIFETQNNIFEIE